MTTAPVRRATRFVSSNQARIAYDPGADIADQASTVVFLHELLSNRFAFEPVQQGIAAPVRSISIDFRGHGASASLANRTYTPENVVDDVKTVIDHEVTGPVHLVGHRFGAGIALAYARSLPDRVASLVLIDPEVGSLPYGNNQLERTARLQAADFAYKGLSDRAIDTYIEVRWGRDWKTGLRANQISTIKRNAPALAALLTALDQLSFKADEMSLLKMPIVLIEQADASQTENVGERLAKMLRNTKRRTVTGLSVPAVGFGDDASSAIAREISAALTGK